jgi:hypothetical protein
MAPRQTLCRVRRMREVCSLPECVCALASRLRLVYLLHQYLLPGGKHTQRVVLCVCCVVGRGGGRGCWLAASTRDPSLVGPRVAVLVVSAAVMGAGVRLRFPFFPEASRDACCTACALCAVLAVCCFGQHTPPVSCRLDLQQQQRLMVRYPALHVFQYVAPRCLSAIR